MPDYVTIKLYEDTRRLLRLIAAESGEQMVQVMQRLCEAEWQALTRLSAETGEPRTQLIERRVKEETGRRKKGSE